MTKPTTLHVRAVHPDQPVPMRRQRVDIDRKTGRDRTMVYHDEPREVPNDSFYRRAIARGDLEEVPRPKATAKPEPAPAPSSPKKPAAKKD